jgi:hypothetical protein
MYAHFDAVIAPISVYVSEAPAHVFQGTGTKYSGVFKK